MKNRSLFAINRLPRSGETLAVQRKRWLAEFMKVYSVLVIGYGAFYLLRTNFKAAQPELITQAGFSTTELGLIGFAFSLTYGFGGLFLGFYFDGKNTKKALSFLVTSAGILAVIIGIVLMTMRHPYGFLILLWSINGLFQAPGGPCSNSTMNRWTPRKLRGRFIGWWNASHNLGAMIAGILAVWGANTFFGGSVAGMFIVPGLVAIPIGIWGFFFGKDDPAELGWETAEEIFDEPKAQVDVVATQMTKGQILIEYVLKNPAVWLLCIANVAAYTVRIGIDNWNVLYAQTELGFSQYTAVNTTFALEIGGLLGSLLWGYFSDKLGGRRALTAAIGIALVILPIWIYSQATTAPVVYGALFFIGFLIFGPVTLIGICVIGFAPKNATVVVNAVPRAFGYVFGDSMAKVLLGRIADPQKEGLTILGHVFHGWESTFTVLMISAVAGLICLAFVAVFEERMLRKDRQFLAAQSSDNNNESEK
ncbi:hexose-6-phosphate:phosphate antiporter [Arcanobacterium phocae]|uniref:hexose-6-phosphate:phosphate antiporter n=1 Tax=Arcanobacterium phocae TaxID=131112 RepID=UPI001C0EECD7|nr:hexose-6-phosphate:phosphate antiporter [Arcanobacterium phocae]